MLIKNFSFLKIFFFFFKDFFFLRIFTIDISNDIDSVTSLRSKIFTGDTSNDIHSLGEHRYLGSVGQCRPKKNLVNIFSLVIFVF